MINFMAERHWKNQGGHNTSQRRSIGSSFFRYLIYTSIGVGGGFFFTFVKALSVFSCSDELDENDRVSQSHPTAPPAIAGNSLATPASGSRRGEATRFSV